MHVVHNILHQSLTLYAIDSLYSVKYGIKSKYRNKALNKVKSSVYKVIIYSKIFANLRARAHTHTHTRAYANTHEHTKTQTHAVTCIHTHSQFHIISYIRNLRMLLQMSLSYVYAHTHLFSWVIRYIVNKFNMHH